MDINIFSIDEYCDSVGDLAYVPGITCSPDKESGTEDAPNGSSCSNSNQKRGLSYHCNWSLFN